MEIISEKITIIYDKDKKKCRLVSSNYNFIKCIIQHFTTENTSAFFVEQYGYSVSSEISVINALGYFDIGLFPLVYKALKEYYPNEQIDIPNKELIFDKVFPLRGKLKLDNILNISKEYELRPYQADAIKACLKYGRGIVECPTASGKSFIIGNIVHNLEASGQWSRSDGSIIIYVPTRQLVDQFYSDLLDYGFTDKQICKFTSNSGKKKDGTFIDNSCKKGFKPLIITNRDFIKNKKGELPKCSVLICDEIHTIGPRSKAIDFVRDIETNIKIGFTGTVPKTEYERWTLIGLFGTILFTETITHLQELGYLAKLKIISLELFDSYVNSNRDLLFSLKTNKKFDKEDTSEDALKFDAAYNEEISYITENLNKLYKKPLEHICNSDNKNILILFDRTEFGQNIYKEAKETLMDRNVYFIDGSIDIGIREKIRAQFEKENGGVVIAQSKTFSTGINIKNLDCIAFFFSGKGFYKVIQSIGRTLRLHKDKEYAKLYDISFNYKYSQRHKNERMELYSECYGKNKFDKVVNMSI